MDKWNILWILLCLGIAVLGSWETSSCKHKQTVSKKRRRSDRFEDPHSRPLA